MKYYSTRRQTPEVSFEEAVITGLPADNGLYMPERIPQLEKEFIRQLPAKSLHEIAFTVAEPFVGNTISRKDLQKIIEDTLSFKIPLVNVYDHIYSLELFHGPTMAFKDVGARFLARCLSYFSQEKVTVIVATSGDTGSAVAHGFLGIDQVDVVILYPAGKVSALQEKQFTTLGQNITAIEIDGTFDDCQHLVKTAFLDPVLKNQARLTSANSINIARLLPQSFYYFWAWSQLPERQKVYFSVPSGNYGNLMAGLLAKKMGLPVTGFIAASNINDVVPQYLTSGSFEPKPSIQTISNAMDVGNPSNFNRITALYNNDHAEITRDIAGYSYTDDETKKALKSVFDTYGYVMDPHGAVGYLGLTEHLATKKGAIGIFLETAHPAKFKETADDIVGDVTIPAQLAKYLSKEKKAIKMKNDFDSLKAFLLAD
ncbi:MAG: threonine synthase [Fulvivirga sp.]|nr:threonine synthase [Fulvivirga sp.]